MAKGLTKEEVLKDSLENTTLPDWVVAGIRQIAYEEFYSYGQNEVDGYIIEWICRLEELQKGATKDEPEAT